MKALITETVIKTFVNHDFSDDEADDIIDVLDSIDFESIVKQKLLEKKITNVSVEVEN